MSGDMTLLIERNNDSTHAVERYGFRPHPTEPYWENDEGERSHLYSIAEGIAFGEARAALAASGNDLTDARAWEALRLIKLACLGTSTQDGWTAKRILGCVTRICIDAGITEPYSELGTEQRYRAITTPHAEIGNRVDAALAMRAAETDKQGEKETVS